MYFFLVNTQHVFSTLVHQKRSRKWKPHANFIADTIRLIFIEYNTETENSSEVSYKVLTLNTALQTKL